MSDASDTIANDASDEATANEAPIHTNISSPPLNDDYPFHSVKLGDSLWEQRIQDEGGAKEALSHTTYQCSQIPLIEPKGNSMFCYNLNAVAIDYI